VLHSAWKSRLSKAALDQILTDTSLNPEGRADQLDVPSILKLCRAIREALETSAG
jgi:hypothetical protein